MAFAWGAMIQVVREKTPIPRMPLAWLVVRAAAARLFDGGMAAFWRLLALAVLGGLGFVLARRFLTQVRPLGLSMAAMVGRSQFVSFEPTPAIQQAWPLWAKQVRTELLRFGDTRPVDLRPVPSLLRGYVLQRYGHDYADRQLIDVGANQIKLKAGDRVRRWQLATERAWPRQGAPPNTGDAFAVLADTLGLSPLGEARPFQNLIAYRVDAPALRLNVPARFPLLFVADAAPTSKTIDALVNAIDVIKESGFFALVIPLQLPNIELDVAAELRRLVKDSPYAHDLIVLSNDDVLDMLIARQPMDVLAQRIVVQADLALVSPFQVEGPVVESMFFGRDAELKTLMEQTLQRDFAVVGNRKIGKTSLLKRAVARLRDDARVRPVFVNCQEVRDAEGFYDEFQREAGLVLANRSPAGFRQAIVAMKQQGRMPVLFLDEVDRLLNAEQASQEPLVGMWRVMSQAQECHFAFFGSTGLASRQDDSSSAFFNFAQSIALRYLERETADMVLRKPLETVGISIESPDALLSQTYAITSGHPNLTQYIGRQLVEAANARGERQIVLEDLNQIKESRDFVEFYFKTIWGEAGSLEKLVTLCAPSARFTFSQLESALASIGVPVDEARLDAALKMLRVYSILEQQGKDYYFVPQAFQDMLNRHQDVDRLIRGEKRALGL